MRYCRFHHDGAPQFGLIERAAGRDEITRVCRAEERVPASSFNRIPAIPFDEVRPLAPIRPTKIVCVGRNYRAHAREFGHEVPSEPLIFLKPPSSVIGPGQTIIRPRISGRVDHEGELGVVIGKPCRGLKEDEDVRPYILGYTCVNDVTARDLQKKDGQWTRAKGFDTFCPVGPLVSDELDPWAGVAVELRVNGTARQLGNTRELIFPLDTVIHHIAQVMTLEPGDLIATGTPEGVGPLVAGDLAEVFVEDLGSLKNPVADQPR